MKRLIATVFAFALGGFAAPAQDIDTRPYVFTQGHNNWTQNIASGRRVEVQLPANPLGKGAVAVNWTYDETASSGVILTEARHVPSPGRIEGFDSVTVFGFSVTPGQQAVIGINANRANTITPDGHYRLTLMPK